MKTIALVFALVGLASVAGAQECPPFPQRGADIIDALVVQNWGLAQGGDDQRRQLTRMIAETMKFELGGWGTKSADMSRPPSKDALSIPGGDDAFCNWDWQNGVTRVRQIHPGQPGERITDQVFIAVVAKNHLTSQPPPPVVVPPVVAPGDPALSRLREMLEQVRTQQDVIKADDDNRDERVVRLLVESHQKLDALKDQLTKHDNEPAFITKALKNRYVQLFMGAAAAWATEHFKLWQ